MGRETCKLLLKQGYCVWGMDLRMAEQIEGLRFIATDVADAKAVTAAYEEIAKETDRLDAVVHMAGIYDMNSLVEMGEEEFLRIFQVNLFGIYRVNRTFMPLLGQESRIILTSSELAPLDPLPFTGIYGITKSAVEKYAFSLRMEVNLLGISVSVIRPGAVQTGLLNVSTTALERFCKNTQLYRCNAAKFKKIVDSVEARSVSPEVIAKTVQRALTVRRPRYVYNVNRNPLLRLLNSLPDRAQVAIIRQILK